MTAVPASTGILGETLRLAAGRDRTGRTSLPALLVTSIQRTGRRRCSTKGDRSSPSRSRERARPWGVLHVVGETPESLTQRDADVARVLAEGIGSHRVASRARPTRSLTSCIASKRCDESRTTSAAGSISIGSWRASSTTRWFCSRVTAARSSSSATDGAAAAEVSRGLSSAYLAERPRNLRGDH